MKTINIATGKKQGKRENVTVWLLPNDPENERKKEPEVQMFWCPYCRNAITQYTNSHVTHIVPGKAPTKRAPTIQIMCRNPNCRRVFHFVGIVSYNGI